MSHFGNIGHHLIVAIIDHIPNGWVMFNGDMTNDPWKQSEATHLFAFPAGETTNGFQVIHLATAQVDVTGRYLVCLSLQARNDWLCRYHHRLIGQFKPSIHGP